MKRLISILLIFTCVMGITQVAYCETHDEKIDSQPIQRTLSYDLVQESSWKKEDSLEKLKLMDFIEQDKLIHNDGLPIETDIFVDDENNSDYLVAIYYTVQNGIPVENFYFTTEPEKNRDELVQRITKNELLRQADSLLLKANSNVMPTATSSTVLKTYNWQHKVNSTVLTELSTKITFERKNKSASYNGQKVSIWDITTVSQYEKVNALKLKSYMTKLSVDKSDQDLLDFGPTGNSSGGTVSVGLTGVVPSLSYSFSISGFSVEDQSSMSGKYGKWTYTSKLASLSSMTTKPGIRVLNESGALSLKISHSMKSSASNSQTHTYTPASIETWIEDR